MLPVIKIFGYMDTIIREDMKYEIYTNLGPCNSGLCFSSIGVISLNTILIWRYFVEFTIKFQFRKPEKDNEIKFPVPAKPE